MTTVEKPVAHELAEDTADGTVKLTPYGANIRTDCMILL